MVCDDGTGLPYQALLQLKGRGNISLALTLAWGRRKSMTVQWVGSIWGLIALLQTSLWDSLSCQATCVVTEASAAAEPVSNHSLCNICSPFSVTVFFRVVSITFPQCQHPSQYLFLKKLTSNTYCQKWFWDAEYGEGFEAGAQFYQALSHWADMTLITPGRW